MKPLSLAGIAAVFIAIVTITGCSNSPPQPPAFPLPQQAAFTPQPGAESTAATRARIHTELGAGYFARGQNDIALEELNEALRNDPNYAPAHGMLGLVYSELRDEARAERSFQRSIEINPQDPEVRNNFGWFLCQRGREPQSLGQFELAINNPLYRTPDMALVNAGRCAAKLGDRKGAEGYFQRALNVAPANPVASLMLVDLAYRAGELELARMRMKYVMLGPAPSPEALLLGVCVERKLADKAAESSYAYQLRQRYPNSNEAKLIDAGGCT